MSHWLWHPNFKNQNTIPFVKIKLMLLTQSFTKEGKRTEEEEERKQSQEERKKSELRLRQTTNMNKVSQIHHEEEIRRDDS